MRFQVASRSEKGPRAANEDAFGVWEFAPGGLAVAVADGLGGLAGGAQAAQLAVNAFGERICVEPNTNLQALALEIHNRICEEQIAEPGARSMATTLSAAVFQNAQLRGVHCGDSRIALSRGSGIKRLTKDQTEAQRLFDAGKLTREEFAGYARKNVLWSALGIQGTPTIETFTHDLAAGDRIFITSDGVHGQILLRELLELSQKADTPDALSALVLDELMRRKPNDNFTFAFIFVS